MARDEWRQHARATAAHSTVTFNETSSAQFVGAAALRRVLGGSPMLAGPKHISMAREERPGAIELRAGHDGYAAAYGLVHQRRLTLAADGTRLDGEDLFLAAGGGALRGSQDQYTVRFHLHPLVKATRLTDGHGVLLVMPNREVWTFSAGDHPIQLMDGVYLAGNDGPRRAAQLVVKGEARSAPRVSWSFQQSSQGATATAAAARRTREKEPRLPL
jgi:uncharacterized heparinase superfamily protein